MTKRFLGINLSIVKTGLVAAAGLLLCAIWAVAVAPVAQSSPPDQGGKTASHNGNAKNSSDYLSPRVQTRVGEKPKTPAAGKTKESDGWAGAATVAVAIGTIALAITGIIGTCAAIKTLKAIQRQGLIMIQQTRVLQRQSASMEGQLGEMQQQRGVMQGQLDTMNKELELEHRPWVGIENPVIMGSHLAFIDDGAHVQCKFKVANRGNAPAVNVACQGNLIIKAHVAIDPAPFNRLVNDGAFVCAAVFPESLHRNNLGISLLPGGQDDLSMSEWRTARTDVPASNLVVAFLVGSIGYSDEFGKPHGTSFVYQFVDQGGRRTFAPTGHVVGTFQVFGLSKAY